MSAENPDERATAGGAEGPLALVGGGEWTPGCDFDRELWRASGEAEVVVLPTAAAYEHPERAVAWAERWFAGLGGRVRGLMILGRADAEDPQNAAVLRSARFVYLGGGSPLHLRSVLKDSAAWAALVEAWREGATIAGSSAGAMVLTDPMVDPRGGALTVGLGLIEQLAVIPHHHDDRAPHVRRTLELAPATVPVAGVPERTALIRDPDGTWRESGAGHVTIYLAGEPATLDLLP